MFRYKDYIPLSRYENGEPDPERHHRRGGSRLQEGGWKRRVPVYAFYAISLFINIYFTYETLSAWPAPLDNYQSL